MGYSNKSGRIPKFTGDVERFRKSNKLFYILLTIEKLEKLEDTLRPVASNGIRHLNFFLK